LKSLGSGEFFNFFFRNALMAQLQLDFPDLEELVSASKEEAIEKLTMLGFPTEEMEDGRLNVEVTQNRPDALCVEGIARALRFYLESKPAIYSVGKSAINVDVDKSVIGVRPFFGGAHVRGVRLTESALRSIMQLQEKLNETLGRKRRKVAIGLHDASKVKPPFRYFACSREEVSFVPLERSERMTPLEILRRHEKGMAYAHLVGELCPMIEDSRHEMLSFPPIINGELTKLTKSTTDVFVDCTGTSHEAVLQAVNIVSAALAERGVSVEGILVNGAPYRILEERKWPLPVKGANRLLGLELSREQVAGHLARMGYRIESDAAYAPRFRADIMNEVDLIEDVAISYGFNNFEPSLPLFASFGHAEPEHPFHEIMVGMGYDEALTFTLSSPAIEAKAGMPDGERLEIENPLTQDFTCFRRFLLPTLLSVLAESKNEKLPIRIYEIGPVASPELKNSLCFASMHAKASFSEAKGAACALFAAAGRDLGFEEGSHGAFMEGRCARLISEGKGIGFLGEVKPEVLVAFGLEQPLCACEISV